MNPCTRLALGLALAAGLGCHAAADDPAGSAGGKQDDPSASGGRPTVGPNLALSQAAGPQAEPFITAHPLNPNVLVAASNVGSLDRDWGAMLAYLSSDGGQTWRTTALPLTDARGKKWSWAADPSIGIDRQGNIILSHVLVDIGGAGDWELALARSQDQGQSFAPAAILQASVDAGSGHGSGPDKPLLTIDNGAESPFAGNIYVTWDDQIEGAVDANGQPVYKATKVLLARSTDGGTTFAPPVQVDDDSGLGTNPVANFGPSVAIGPGGEVYVAWANGGQNQIRTDRSSDGGKTFAHDLIVAHTVLSADTGIPSMKSRRAIMYPVIDVDRSAGPRRGRVHVVWMDQASQEGPFVDGGEVGVFHAFSDGYGQGFSKPVRVTDHPGSDQYNPWLSVDASNGAVELAWRDTRNDPARVQADFYFACSIDGGQTFGPNLRVSAVSSDESCPDGTAASDCPSDPQMQWGDYEGLVSSGGLAHPVWTDHRTGQARGEKIFTSTISSCQTAR